MLHLLSLAYIEKLSTLKKYSDRVVKICITSDSHWGVEITLHEKQSCQQNTLVGGFSCFSPYSYAVAQIAATELLAAS